MDYQVIHDRIIERALDRNLSGYKESHHITPKCMGGTDSNDNKVDLTAEEHYVVHQLLVKIHPNNHKLIHAANMMGGTRPNNKSYGWIKRKNSNILKGHTRNKGENHHMYGKTHSKETRKKISESLKGQNSFFYGKDHSGENNGNFKPLKQTDKDLIMQFPDWREVKPQTISKRLRKQKVSIGYTRIKRLQDSF